jgi:hypothetical protein
MKLAKPTNQTAEVLYLLITEKSINRKSALIKTGVLCLTGQIARLRNTFMLDVKCIETKTKNKFGRSISFGVWSVSKKLCDQKKLVEKYNKINC